METPTRKRKITTSDKRLGKRVFRKKSTLRPSEIKKVKERQGNPKSWAEVVNRGPVTKPEEKVTEVEAYPPPDDDPIFVRRWRDLIDTVTERKNFKIGHLHQLEELCHLYVEAAELREYLKENGRSYTTTSPQGNVEKLRPEVAQLNRVRSEVRNYNKILGILLFKDSNTVGKKQKEEEWK